MAEPVIKLPVGNHKVDPTKVASGAPINEPINSPANEPPVNDPPANEPPVVVDPPVNDPPVNEPPVNEPDNQIDIDGVIYELNEAGDAVNAEGVIVHTADAIARMYEQDDDPETSVEDIAKLSGIQIIGEDGNPVEYEFTVEGLAKREADVKAIGEKEGFAKGFEQFLAANPDVAGIIDYKKRYGTVEGYSSHVDYTKMELSADENERWKLIYDAEIHKGASADRAKRLADFSKNDNTLEADATEALEYLKREQLAVETSKQQQMQAQELAARQQDINFYGVDYEENGAPVKNVEGSVYDLVVNKGEINGYKIPIEGIRYIDEKGNKALMSRKQLFSYLCDPAVEENGVVYSKAQLDMLQMFQNPAKYVMTALQGINGGVDNLIKSAVDTATVKKIKVLSTTKQNRKTGKQGATAKTEQPLGQGQKIKLPVQ